VPRINPIRYRLPDEMRADRPTTKVVFFQHIPFFLNVIGFGERAIHFKLIAPACELETIKSPLARLLRELFKRQVRPLSGEKCNGSSRRLLLLHMIPENPVVYFGSSI
jgi:hypothetical protein